MMNIPLKKFLAWSGPALVLVGVGAFGTSSVLAGDKHKNEYKRHDGQAYRHQDVNRDLRRQEEQRRAFVAGAAAQQHREEIRDYNRGGDRYGPNYGYRNGYDQRYRDRYPAFNSQPGSPVPSYMMQAETLEELAATAPAPPP